MTFRIIVSYCKERGIGFNNEIPWKNIEDLQKIKKLTIGKGNNALIMGKNTHLKTNFFKKRDNLILSSSLEIDEKKNGNIIKSFSSIELLMKYLQNKNYETIWIIGGESIYKQFLQFDKIDYIYTTFINEDYKCDKYMPELPLHFSLFHSIKLEEEKFFHEIYKKIKKGDKLIYKKTHICHIIDIHYDDMPYLYFTIKYENKEVQTSISNLSYQ